MSINDDRTTRDAIRPQRVNRSWTTHLPAFLLIAVGFILGISASLNMSMTIDELYHLTGGYTYWKTNDYRMHPENGNLPQLLTALPLNLMDLRSPPQTGRSWQRGNMLNYGREFFFDMGNNPHRMLIAGRSMIGLMTVALWTTIYLIALRLFGRSAALVSLTLSVMCPNLLSHGFLATSDACATFFFLLAMVTLCLAFQRPSASRLFFAAIAVGGLCLSKFSAPLLAPMALLLMAGRIAIPPPLISRWRATRMVMASGIIIAAGAVVIIWASYGFRFDTVYPTPGISYKIEYPWENMIEHASPPMQAVIWARDHRLLPEAFLFGQCHTLRFSGERYMFLNGQYSTMGWPHYFLYTTLVKTPLGTLAIWIIAAVLIVIGRRRFNWGPLPAALGILLLVYAACSIFSSINIGHRHFLPAYPPLMIFSGAAWSLAQSRRIRYLLLLLIAATVGQTIASWPDYLPFTNGLAGGPASSWRHLADSNIDWGQDMERMERWLMDQRIRSPQTPIHVSYFGPTELSSDLADRRLLYTFPYHTSEFTSNFIPKLEPGLYILSVNMLTGLYHPLVGPWTARYESQYQQAIEIINQLNHVAGDDQVLTEFLRRYGLDNMRYFNALREGRLYAYLRQRQPIDHIGYSFMIYRVSAEEMEQAMHGPPPEIQPEIYQRSWENIIPRNSP